MHFWRSPQRLVPAVVAALVLNAALLASSALLARERPVVTDLTEPVGVNLVTLKPATPPRPPEKRETPPPRPKPKLKPDFTPELARPSLDAPDPTAIRVELDPSLLQGGPATGGFVFNASDLDTPPRAVVRSNPVYPYKARQRNIEGVVEVRFLVGADGSISNISIISSDPQGLFDDAVMKTIPNWRFRPGVLDGQAVPSWVVTAVEFRLGG